jgi:hypothetical protein
VVVGGGVGDVEVVGLDVVVEVVVVVVEVDVEVVAAVVVSVSLRSFVVVVVDGFCSVVLSVFPVGFPLLMETVFGEGKDT